MRGRAARSSCSCSTTSRGLGVSDLRPSKLTEPDPERDFGDWRRRRKRTTTDGSADAGATALVELVGVDCPNDCPVPSCRRLPGMPRAALGLCHRCMSRHRTTRDGTTRQIRFRVKGLVPLTGRAGLNPASDTSDQRLRVGAQPRSRSGSPPVRPSRRVILGSSAAFTGRASRSPRTRP
jgi:hypothetical protein